MAKRTDVRKLKVGDKFYRVVHYEVTGIDDVDPFGQTVVHTVSDTAGESSLSSGLVEKSAFTTDQYVSEHKVTRTEIAQKIETLGHAAFKVVFRKQVAANDVADGLVDADVTTQTKRRKLVKKLMEGEERVMHARLHRTEEFDASMELGRYRVLDLDELLKHGTDGDHTKKAFRMIDTRTITELVVDNKRYYV